MKKIIGNYEFELSNDTILIRDASTGELSIVYWRVVESKNL